LINFTNTTVCLTPIRFRNLKTNLAAAASLTWRPANGSATPARASTIWAYNQTYALSNVNSSTEAWTIERDVIDGVYIGQAFLCNVVEPVGPTSSAFIGMGSGGGTSNMFNLMLFNNTILQKMNSFYDDGTVWPRLYSPTWVVGNFDDDCNIKGDEGSPADGGRYGNRPQIYCVGYSHNLLPETYNIGSPGSFQQGQTDGFPGVNSYATNSIIGSTNTMWKFTRRGSFAITTGVGNGDYRYLSTSPAFQFVGPRVLSHKTDGATTSEVDPPGAFTSGNLRHAGIGF
jgi:hypothetical protein